METAVCNDVEPSTNVNFAEGELRAEIGSLFRTLVRALHEWHGKRALLLNLRSCKLPPKVVQIATLDVLPTHAPMAPLNHCGAAVKTMASVARRSRQRTSAPMAQLLDPSTAPPPPQVMMSPHCTSVRCRYRAASAVAASPSASKCVRPHCPTPAAAGASVVGTPPHFGGAGAQAGAQRRGQRGRAAVAGPGLHISLVDGGDGLCGRADGTESDRHSAAW